MDSHSEQPLHRIVFIDEFYNEVRERLEDPNEKDSEGKTLLHVAALGLMDNSRNLKLLIDKGADLNSVTPEGYTALHFAVCSRNRNAVVALIEAGASINSKDSFGRTPLHFAITRRWTNPPTPFFNLNCDIWTIKRILCHSEINLDSKDEAGETPLMCAVKERHSYSVKALLKKGADPNIPNKDNRTPLHVALLARNPSYKIIVLLLNSGSNIYHEDKFRMTPMGILIRNVHDDESLEFVTICLRIVAFRYQIRQNLKRDLGKIPQLSNELDECCKEVKLMTKVRIVGKFTLYDFTLDCFQAQVENPLQAIYTPLVQILLTGLFSKYEEYIILRIPRRDMSRMLYGLGIDESEIPIDASNSTIYKEIRRLYDENYVLKERLLKLKEFLIKKFNTFGK